MQLCQRTNNLNFCRILSEVLNVLPSRMHRDTLFTYSNFYNNLYNNFFLPRRLETEDQTDYHRKYLLFVV